MMSRSPSSAAGPTPARIGWTSSSAGVSHGGITGGIRPSGNDAGSGTSWQVPGGTVMTTVVVEPAGSGPGTNDASVASSA